MTTKTKTTKTATPDVIATLANVTLTDVVAAWDTADKQDAAVARARGALALAVLPIGTYLLALDAKHGDATAANEVFRTELSADYEGRGKTFHWVKSRASKARNLARGVVALATMGIDATKDAGAVSALGVLASNVGADGMADAAAAVAALVGEGKSIQEAAREVSAKVRESKSAESTESTTVSALTSAVEALDAYAEGGWDALTPAELATIKPLVKRLAALSANVNKALA